MNKKSSLGVLSLAVLFIGLFLMFKSQKPQSAQQTQPEKSPQVLANQTKAIGTRSKLADCANHEALQDIACTPGQILLDATREQICTSGYSKQVRNVPQSEKDEVYREYNIDTRKPGEYEVDHLISLELGGSNDIANLWPEPAEPRPGFHEKDKVENYLHNKVCSGEITLSDAQIKIANNWLEIYNNIPK